MDHGEYKINSFWVEDAQMDKLKLIKEGGFVLTPLTTYIMEALTKKMSKFINLLDFMKAKDEITNTYKDRLAEVLARYPEIDAAESKAINDYIFSVANDPFVSAEFKEDVVDYDTRFESLEIKLQKYHFKYEATGVATCLDFDLVVTADLDKSLPACRELAKKALEGHTSLPEPKANVLYEKNFVYFIVVAKVG